MKLADGVNVGELFSLLQLYKAELYSVLCICETVFNNILLTGKHSRGLLSAFGVWVKILISEKQSRLNVVTLRQSAARERANVMDRTNAIGEA